MDDGDRWFPWFQANLVTREQDPLPCTAKIVCPICNKTFSETYYENFHTPCPVAEELQQRS